MNTKTLFTTLSLTTAMVLAAPAGANNNASDKQSQFVEETTYAAELQQQHASSRLLVVTGKVIYSKDIKLDTLASKPHRLIKLKTPSDEVVVVDLGEPAAKTLNPKKGNHIFVMGEAGEINNKPMVIAQYAGELKKVGKGSHAAERQFIYSITETADGYTRQPQVVEVVRNSKVDNALDENTEAPQNNTYF